MLRSMSLRGRSLWRSRQRRSILNRIATRSVTARNDEYFTAHTYFFRGTVTQIQLQNWLGQCHSELVSESVRRYR